MFVRLYPSLGVYVFSCIYFCICMLELIISICACRGCLHALASISNLGQVVWCLALEAKLLSEEGFRARMSVAMEMAQSCCV